MDEENVQSTPHEETAQTQQPTARDLGIPIAIVIAGLAIAVAIFFGGRVGNRDIRPADTGSAAGTSTGTVDPVTSADHILGNPDAKVVVVEYSDTECPFCKVFHPTLQRIMNEYGKDGKVAWVYRHYPLPFHTKSPHEAEATECAAKLGGNKMFWSYLGKVFDITPANNQLDPAELPKIAKKLGLDETAFNNCLSGDTLKPVIQKDIESGGRAGLQGTPYSIILVNKKKVDIINGAQPYEVVKSQIEQALRK